MNNLTARTVDAEENYWGSTENEWDAGAQPGDVNGTVLTGSHLISTSAPVLARVAPGAGEDGEMVVLCGANFGSGPSYCPSLEFAGDDYVRLANLPYSATFTVEAWVKRASDAAGYEVILSDAEDDYAAAMVALYVDGGSVDCGGVISDQFAYYQSSDDAVQCSGVTAHLDRWYHVAVSRDACG